MEGKQEMTQQTLFGSELEPISNLLPKVDIYMSGVAPSRVPCCCIISEFGFKLGMRSDVNFQCKNCNLSFIDNKFLGYNHNQHMKCVMNYRPKVATLRDYFNREQCTKLGIEYYSLDQLKEHAREFLDTGITPIIIPKFNEGLDEVNDISNISEYIVGYSLAGKFGKAKRLPLSSYIDRGWKIHLLGGSPEVQMSMYSKYPDNIVSMDSSMISHEIRFNRVWKPKHFTCKNTFKINSSTEFPRPGYACYSLLTAMSMTNLYNYIISIQ